MTALLDDPSELRSVLGRVDAHVRRAVDAFRHELTERARDPFRGLYISDADADELLAERDDDHLHDVLAPLPARMRRLVDLFQLDEFECEALLVCLAPDIDLRYERLYAYLQDDVTRKRPTVDLVLRLLRGGPAPPLLGRESLGPNGALVRAGILELGEPTAPSAPLLARPLRLDERIVEYLLGSDRPDARIDSFARLVPPDGELHAIAPELHALPQLLASAKPMLVYLCGPSGTAPRARVHSLALASRRAVVYVDATALLDMPQPAQAMAMAAREALLQSAILAVDSWQVVLRDEPERAAVRAELRDVVAARRGQVLLLGDARWEPATWAPEAEPISIELPPLSAREVHDLWQAHLGGSVADTDLQELASRYRLDLDGLHAVAASARGQAARRGLDEPAIDDIRLAARSVASPPLGSLAQRLDARYSWSDIVLPADGVAQLHELCARVAYRQRVLETWGYGRKHVRRGGVTALFAGPPGTGKTMAAEIVAGELGLMLYRIDLSATVSKYIGETEKNLEQIFRAADQGDAVLLFDEADALFGKRSEVQDAHDRYANVEIAYLLQRLESYSGIAILTTNLRGNIDEAFIRRLEYVVEFPLPDEPERFAIWQRALPVEAPRDTDIDLRFIARKFKLSGGHIRNIALTAAFLASADGDRIGMKHLIRATRREYQKLGKLTAESDFEHYYPLLKNAGGDS